VLEAVQWVGCCAAVVAGEGPAVWNQLAIDDDGWNDGGEAFEMQENIDTMCPGTAVVDVDDIAVVFSRERGTWI
jgi:hypothetical protein